MKAAMLIITLSALCLFVTNPSAQEPYQIGSTYKLQSEILNEERTFHVYLPRSYDATQIAPKKYPVLYLLDGGFHFHTTTGIINFLNNSTDYSKRIPHLIIVAIENTNRNRDLLPTKSLKDYFGEDSQDFELSGGGDMFLSFIEKELVPEIEKKFRALPTRIIVGHSFGGLLALHSLVNRPTIFQSYIAVDPSLWWDNQTTANQAQKAFDEKCTVSGTVFIANSIIPEGLPAEPMEKGRIIFEDTLAGCKTDSKYNIKLYSDEEHNSVFVPALMDGLATLFSNYTVNYENFADSPKSILSHFKGLSQDIGGDFPPDETILVRFGYYLLDKKADKEKALEIFKLNYSLFKDSRMSLNNLALVYRKLGDNGKAIELYRENLDKFPDDETSATQIESINNEERKKSNKSE